VLGALLVAGGPVHGQGGPTRADANAPARGDFDELPILVADSDTAYIDNAAIGSSLRLRLDAAFDNEFPDRAEFFYAKCGCFGDDAPGPVGDASEPIENSLDSYELRLDVEHALRRDFSVFAELPLRAIDGAMIDSEAGLGDVSAGFKYALLADSNQALTLQLRGYFPTGDAEKGLGNDHYSIEPGLLYLRKLGACSTVAAELRYWHPIDGSSADGTGYSGDYAGDIIRYGAGYSYDFTFSSGLVVTPVVELVVWEMLDGLALTSPDGTPARAVVKEVDGDTIANVKLGLRWQLRRGLSIYAGYGRGITNDKWYDDVWRVEFRLSDWP
jgi:hypothetical protein